MIRDVHRRLLLPAVNDEFAAKHGNIRIKLFGRLVLVSRPRTVECIAGAMAADVSLAVGNRLEERLFALGRHGRFLVPAFFGEVAGRFKQKGVEFVEVLVDENPAVLGGGDLEAMLFAQLRDDGFRQRELAVFGQAKFLQEFFIKAVRPFDDVVFVGLRAGEH